MCVTIPFRMSTSLPKFPFVILDTEATGLFPRIDHILELAILRFEQGEKVAEYSTLFHTDSEIPAHVQVLTRIRPADIEGKPGIREESEKIQKLLEGALVVGHNIPYDLGMLKGEGMDVEAMPWVDTAMLASLLFPELASWSLGYISSVLPLPHEPKHRALGDVHATLALFEKEWGRLSEIPTEKMKTLQALAEKGPEGYALLFSSMQSAATVPPSWLQTYVPRGGVKNPQEAGKSILSEEALTPPPEGAVTLLGSPPTPSFLSHYLHNLPPLKKEEKVWVAVKNLESSLRLFSEKDLQDATILYPPALLLNPEAETKFLAQDTFSAPELTLALKLLLFRPRVQADAPVHSEERDVWKAKVAATKDSPVYRKQFEDLKSRIIIDHYHLLDLLAESKGPESGERVIVDDASMLEDTATKAFRWICSSGVLRAGAEGGEEALTRFLDLYQLFIERVRNDLTIRYLVEADLRTPEVKGLRQRLEELLSTSSLSENVRERLLDLQKMLVAENLEGRIAWIEQFRDGDQVLQSVPFDIASLLWEVLYDKCATTLLLPPGAPALFPAIVPPQIDTVRASVTAENDDLPHILYTDPRLSLERLIAHVDGKVIALVGSKRVIEQLYIAHAERLEQAGVTLIAQGLSGGQGRMQAEFLAAEGPTLWLLTPWTYEGVDLPAGSCDHLWIHTLPFDHPSHAVLSIRSDRYKNPFEEYLLPRLFHRLFRLVRTYMLHRNTEGDVLILDERIRTKEYGAKVRTYVQTFSAQRVTSTPPLPLRKAR